MPDLAAVLALQFWGQVTTVEDIQLAALPADGQYDYRLLLVVGPELAARYVEYLRDPQQVWVPPAGDDPDGYWRPQTPREAAFYVFCMSEQEVYTSMAEWLQIQDVAAHAARLDIAMVSVDWINRLGEMTALVHTDPDGTSHPLFPPHEWAFSATHLMQFNGSTMQFEPI